MPTSGTLSLIGLFQWDNTLFKELAVPAAITTDKDSIIIPLILEKAGNLEVLYPDWEFLQNMIRVWSNSRVASWERMYTALTEEYNPLHNFDRNEEYTDTRTASDSKTVSGTSSGDTNSTNKVTAFNESTFQNHDQNTSEVSQTTSGTESNTANDNSSHSGHLYGNIGVTKSQEMLMDEIGVREKYDMYNIIADEFIAKFCILVY